MQGRRRALRLAGLGLTAALAGCSSLVRQNDAPGGLKFQNERAAEQVVTVRAYLLTPQTPDDDTPTPVDKAPVAQGQFRLPANTTALNDTFFENPGTYLIAASNQGQTVRDRIKLFETFGGGVGVDTVVITLPAADDIRMSVTGVD